MRWMGHHAGAHSLHCTTTMQALHKARGLIASPSHLFVISLRLSHDRHTIEVRNFSCLWGN